MSGPHTNMEKQKKRHWPPLLGMALVTVFGVGVILYWLGEEATESDPPAPAAIEGEAADAPVQSPIPPEVIEPEAQPGVNESPASPPTTQESPALPAPSPAPVTE